jgi:hypothetical protein
MQVHCRCGQAFTILEARFPHHLSCHVCGGKFVVLEGGTTEEITTEPVHAKCRCGKDYIVRYGPFPRNLHCLDCNRKFSVLSTGETIQLQDEAGEPEYASSAAIPTQALPATSIQTSPLLHSLPGISTAIVDDMTKDLLAAASGLPNADRLERELKAIDLEWEAEQYQACVIRVFGHMVMASPRFVVALGIFGLLAMILSTLVTVTSLVVRPMASAYLAELGMAVGAGLIVYVLAKSRGLQRLVIAERTWRRKRREAILKYSPWAHRLPPFNAADGPSD